MAPASDQSSSYNKEKRPLAIAASAWITGLSYLAGIVVVGADPITGAILVHPLGLLFIPLSYAAFLASVMLIQRYMRKSLISANFGTPQKLVTSGIFAWSRNPIYAAFFMPLLALATLSWLAAGVGFAVYIVLMELFVIRPEEAELAEIFGRDFANWKAKTRRWI